jgi:4-alpha-glucanotransferase
MDDSSLYEQAARLGVETSFTDVFGQVHAADREVLSLVVETLNADRAAHRWLCDPVMVITHEDLHHGADRAHNFVLPLDLEVTDGHLIIHDGVPSIAQGRTEPVSVQRSPGDHGSGIILPADLPVGCHSLEITTTRGDCLITLVVPPASMLPTAPWMGGAAVFAPTYALWEKEAPLPSYGLLGRMARRLGEAGVELMATLPLYAAFLDDPVEPSPYSPASRLHWNEALISEHLVDLPGSGSIPLQIEQLTRHNGRYIDWAALGARRRRQMLVMADNLDDATRAAVHRFTHDRPDVSDFARFLAERSTSSAAGMSADKDLQIRSHELAQYLADKELRQIASSDGAGLALDLPIGCHPQGYERWAAPEVFADQMSIGAPPDRVFDGGQDWGLPPTLPTAMRHSGHRLWRDLLARAGEHAALVRIDHVMAVHRLWWIPAGMESGRGVYVRYPREELMAVIAATAAAVGTTVVGENLGTVPEEVSESMERWGMLGMYEEQFHLHDRPLPRIPSRCVAGIRTHDMTPFRSHVESDPDGYGSYRRQLPEGSTGQIDTGASDSSLIDAVMDRLVHSPAALVQIDLDDLCGVREPHNLPGQISDTLWSRRLDAALSETLADHDLDIRIRRLGARKI